jgi:hypothetical protein
MKLKKNYSFTNKRAVWRLIPSGNKLLIEERDEKNKQVYYNCVRIETGKYLLKDFQTDEKFWTGVEAFEDDKIYFHRFVKPDMPGHIGIYVYDLASGGYLWKHDDLVFLFLYQNRLFTFNQKFESREFFELDPGTGRLVEEYGENPDEINRLREKLLQEEYEKYKNYLFPEAYDAAKIPPDCSALIEKIKENEIISGIIDFVKYNDLLMLSFHSAADQGKLNNTFRVIEIDTGKIILEDVLNAGITSYIPDSFFIRDNLLFLIKNKIELIVYSLV